METGAVLFSRYNDGARPVRVVADGWEVQGSDGTLVKFTTTQALLAELTGHPTGRHWSFNRYFGLGDYRPKADRRPGQGNILDLFEPLTPPTAITLLEPLAPPILAFKPLDTAISVPTKNLENRHSRTSDSLRRSSGVVVSGAVGIDLVHRSDEVRKLLFSGFGRRIFAAGHDPEDVLQEVYRGLLARNRGTCPWDPAKSSFGHYVYMVCSCVLANFHRKESRKRQFEQVGLTTYSDSEYGNQDVAANTTIPAQETLADQSYQLTVAVDDLADFMLELPGGASDEARLALDAIPYLTQGLSRVDIARALGVSQTALSRAVAFLRDAASAWREERLH